MKSKFIHTISKGSRFNQIYIPKKLEHSFEVGDIVEVKIIEKKVRLFYSKSIKHLTPFKENIIKRIFAEINQFKEIKQIFVIGSFLTKNEDYNDLDILVVLRDEKINEKLVEKRIYEHLVQSLQLKYHLIIIKESILNNLIKKCPLTRSMLYNFVSNNNFELTDEMVIDKNHTKFLLMMPEDTLKVKVASRVLYDSIRRLITIQRFLDKKDSIPSEIDKDTKKILGETLYNYTMNNEEIDDKIRNMLRAIIKIKLETINKKLDMS
ncbi:hypothetical protein COU57_05760 [Candidatus Pacearchaeota archaeon CG10_big_fil_rev_8_21_14_0_10_32_14]|nr:MAG: hypothetical protein COU57_05760 [Candidatus Pacearchaeota archaeon CG10_big_fil_rev_8_21_14_0_10_32_14]